MGIVQTKKGNGGGYVQSFNFTPDSACTAGNFMRLVIANGISDVTGVSDNQSNTWIKAIEHNGSGRQILIYYAYNNNGGSPQVTITTSNFADTAYIFTEQDELDTTTDPLDKTVGATTSGTTHASGNTATTSQAREYLVGAAAFETSAPGVSGDASWSNLNSQAGFDSFTSVAVQDRFVTSTGAYGITFTTTATPAGAVAVATFKEASTLQQEGYRFRADDGSESGATWLANQDTNISRGKNTNTRLRVILNATGDPASQQYQLEGRVKGGGGSWVPIHL